MIRLVTSCIKRHDKPLAALFAALSVAFVAAVLSSADFMHWAFARHGNILSWYIRPLFLIPFCLFAFRRSAAGISATLFLLLTSMVWFPPPLETGDSVRRFLAFEQAYLMRTWELADWIMTLLVPATLALLAYAFWRRNLRAGLFTLALIAVIKSLWSLFFGGDSGAAVILPAAVGLLICCVIIYRALH